ncbi:MAG: thiamine pyrophosphate-binding protein [Candidatus Kapabacteria bacterium]|nr:thiamine pyrophosphate-binding protein [Candidatus Kapabacteria bacterium]
MDGGLLTATCLKKQGVQALFTLCGGHISPILLGCKQLGIKVVDTRHEVNAVFAADAVARLTGVPGVAAVTAGPGVANTITAIKNAQMAQSPLILLGGAAATVLRGRGSLQDIDQMALMKPHVKEVFAITKVSQIPSALKAAFEIAQSGVPGPVFVELPIDVLYPEALIREWYIKDAQPGKQLSFQQKALNWYLGRHLNGLFGGLDEAIQSAESLALITPSINEPSRRHVRAAAALLANAERPVMVIGSQTLVNPRRVADVAAAVEKLGCPVYLSGMARGLLGSDHPLQMRHKRKEALKEADVVLLSGVPADFRLDYGNHISRKATYIAVNRSDEDLTKNRTPNLAVLADPASFFVALADANADTSANSGKYAAWTQKLRERDNDRNADIAVQAAASLNTPQGDFLNPLHLFRAMDDVFENKTVLVADGGDFVATASYSVQPRKPLSWYDPGVFGTLGVGAGFALGVKAVQPDAEVWIIYGDGSSGYSLMEFDTFKRHNMGIIAVIGNDAGWTQIARDQVVILGDDVGTVLDYTDYHIVAQGLGGAGAQIRSNDQIATTLRAAKQSAASGVPYCINALIGKSEFRKGSLSM